MIGGSEFAAEFEQACQQRGLRLFVLPPRSPKLNGAVERAQRTHTEEFYQITDCSLEMAALNRELREWEKTYNTVRPHQSLGYLTWTAKDWSHLPLFRGRTEPKFGCLFLKCRILFWFPGSLRKCGLRSWSRFFLQVVATAVSTIPMSTERMCTETVPNSGDSSSFSVCSDEQNQ